MNPPPERADILLVEDDELVQFMVRRRLRNSGLTLAVCDTADEAEAFLAAGQVPLLLLDLRLPGRDGDELLDSLVTAGLVSDTTVYVCTSAMPPAALCQKIENLGASVVLKEVILEKGCIATLHADAACGDSVRQA